MNDVPHFVVDANGKTIGMYPPFVALQRRGRCCPYPLFVTCAHIDNARDTELCLRKQRYRTAVYRYNDLRAVLIFLLDRFSIIGECDVGKLVYKRMRKHPTRSALEELERVVQAMSNDLERAVFRIRVLK